MTSLDHSRERIMRIDLLHRLSMASVGGCSCLTKTPELVHHATMCHYRLFEEARQEILKLEGDPA